ncbi:alpha/beta hydrolase [Micrococcus sp.]|uniref:alpha/beta fold hydrolase n=1 Tax=Micrococcus sp. TaxID=1271 RepID=UPI002A90C984|nr:alpha/beta hydrolase [Micrococcus sp.]MDY6055002.1 alpha/beta hydrolase [Micrococcus sp.]
MTSTGLPPLTLVHGIGGRPGHVLPVADALGVPRAQVAAPALPRHNDAGPVGAAGGLPADVPSTAAWLLERTPTAGRLLVGHSTGGVLALAMAGLLAAPAGAPAAGAGTADGADVGASTGDGAEARLKAGVPAGVVVVDSNVPVAPDAVAARARKAQLARRTDWRAAMRGALARDWAGPALWRERVFADLDATADEPMRSLWESVLRTDSRALWAGLRPPVGEGCEEDGVGRCGAALPVLYVRATREVEAADVVPLLAPGVELTVVRAGAGHWPHLQDPPAVAEAIGTWWAARTPTS